MRRDLTRDLEVLDHLSVPELLEDAERRALGPDRGPVLGPSPARRLVVTASLAMAVVGLAIAGFVWLSSAFRATPAPPAEPADPNYVLTHVRLDPSHVEPEGNILIRLEVSWSNGTYPGIHRCVFRASGTDGRVVSERVERWMALEETDNLAIEVPQPSSSAVAADAWCDPERLDAPGIADLEPLDPASVAGEPDAFDAEVERRTDEWAALFSIDSMTTEELAANMAAMGYGRVHGRFSGDEQMWAWLELRSRWARLCSLLPDGHELRNSGC
jgi:hypothetical protein